MGSDTSSALNQPTMTAPIDGAEDSDADGKARPVISRDGGRHPYATKRLPR